MTVTILQGDVRAVLPTLPEKHFHCVVTSPPFWGLRDYGTAQWEGGDPACNHTKRGNGKATWGPGSTGSSTLGGKSNNDNHEREGFKGGICGHCGARRIDNQLGLEPLHDCLGWATGNCCGECFVCHMVEVMRGVWRVLRDDGTLLLNLGDSYAGAGVHAAHHANPGISQAARRGADVATPIPPGLKQKDLCGVPWRVALALQADGWYLRSDIIWEKKSCLPESVQDRPTKSHEYIFLLSKQARYFWDAEAVRETNSSPEQLAHNLRYAKPYEAYDQRGGPDGTGQPGNENNRGIHARPGAAGRNLRSVWTLGPEPLKAAHYAPFPSAIPRRAILAGTSEHGCCATCGAPYARVIDKTNVDHSTRNGSRFDDGKNLANHPNVGRREDAQTATTYEIGSSANRLALLRQQARQNGGEYVNATQTVGWRATCDHNAPVVPCRVLDPFGGSGTSGKVATELARDCTLIELNSEYVKLCERRVTDAQPGLRFVEEA